MFQHKPSFLRRWRGNLSSKSCVCTAQQHTYIFSFLHLYSRVSGQLEDGQRRGWRNSEKCDGILKQVLLWVPAYFHYCSYTHTYIVQCACCYITMAYCEHTVLICEKQAFALTWQLQRISHNCTHESQALAY